MKVIILFLLFIFHYDSMSAVVPQSSNVDHLSTSNCLAYDERNEVKT